MLFPSTSKCVRSTQASLRELISYASDLLYTKRSYEMLSEYEPPSRILRIGELIKRVGLARSTIYDRLDQGSPRYDATFPKPLKVGVSAVGWMEDEVETWIYVKRMSR